MKTIKTYLSLAALLAAVVLIVSACGGGSGSSGTAMGSGSSTAEGISVSDVDGVGEILADRQGVALYFSDQEAGGGTVLCTESCTTFWDPLTLANGDKAPAGDPEVDTELGTIQRPDGREQVTFEGKPLYRFTEDTGPGVVSGDGFVDSFDGQEFSWHVATPDGTSTSSPDRSDFGY